MNNWEKAKAEAAMVDAMSTYRCMVCLSKLGIGDCETKNGITLCFDHRQALTWAETQVFNGLMQNIKALQIEVDRLKNEIQEIRENNAN